ncbi:hypothetical protein C2S53_013058 [Perilla frutescens var. hirtella]|uniref:Transmembrane protein n=1 Tax=Perilla frutescens var. hirtella TaxID=608512 RepID=A0AAD4P584_PERFH|nr:hypothetical protein C2S53_013058 [Perilla frutescens var. hirtella]
MQTPLHLVSDPFFLFASNVNLRIPPNLTKLPSPIHNRFLLGQKATIVCAANRRKRHGIAKSGKLMLESAYMVASHLRILPEPVELILREFGAGNGGGRNGFWSGFGWGGSGGWRRRRKSMILGMVGILVIMGAVGLWWIVGKELVLDSDACLGGLGLVLFGLSAEVWRRGAKDWVLGFCCCAFLVALVSTKGDFRALLRTFGSFKKGRGRRKRSLFSGFLAK